MGVLGKSKTNLLQVFCYIVSNPKYLTATFRDSGLGISYTIIIVCFYIPIYLLLEKGQQMRLIDEKYGRYLVLAWGKHLGEKVRLIDLKSGRYLVLVWRKYLGQKVRLIDEKCGKFLVLA